MSLPDAGAGDVRAMLRQAFVNLGATPAQADVMSAQLLKRAAQLALERGIPEPVAMAELLQKVVAGRRGDYAGGSGKPPAEPGSSG